MRTLSILTGLLGVAVLTAPARAGEVSLRWKLAKGEVLRYKLTVDQRAGEDPRWPDAAPPKPRNDETSGAPGAEDEPFVPEPAQSKQQRTIVWRLSVQEVDPAGNARVVCRYEAVSLEMDQMMLGHVAWDSTKKEDATRAEDPTIRPFAQLVGQEFNFKLSPLGAVSDVKGYEAILRASLGGLEDNPIAKAALTSGLGEDWVRATLERAFAIVPDSGAAETGASWTRASDQAMPLFGTLRFETTYKLTAVAGARAKIAAATALSRTAAPPAAAPGEIAGATEIEWKGGRGEGTLVFDVDKGCLASSESRAEMTLRAKAKMPVAPADGPGAVANEVKVRQVVKVELLEGT